MSTATELEKFVAFVYSLTESKPFVSGTKATTDGTVPTWKLALSLVTSNVAVPEELLPKAKSAIYWVSKHLRPNTHFEVSLLEAVTDMDKDSNDILVLAKDAAKLACIPMVYEKSLGYRIDLSNVSKPHEFIDGQLKYKVTVTGVYVGHIESPPVYGSEGYRKVFFCTPDGHLVCIYQKPPYVSTYVGALNISGIIHKRMFDSEAFYTVLTRSKVTPA